MRRSADIVVVGSGINSLVAAAFLARAGRSVLVLEREPEFGGACRTTEATRPGYRHDLLAAWHPLWLTGPGNAVLGAELARHGLEYVNSDLPAGSLYPDGKAAFLYRSTEQTAAHFEELAAGEGESWRSAVDEFERVAEISFGVLGTELWSLDGCRLGLKAVRQLGARGAASYLGESMMSARSWLDSTFSTAAVKGLLAPWALHAGMGPDDAMSGLMAKVICISLQEAGCPIPRGGSAALVDALVGLIEAHGGELLSNVDVERVLVSDGRAAAVLAADGQRFDIGQAILANVTPKQLYRRLLADVSVPSALLREADSFKAGRAGMQIHLAMSEPPRFNGDSKLSDCADIHVTTGLDGVSRSVNESIRGLLPAEPTIVVGQPLNLDPSRAPAGAGLLWIQLQEVPWIVRGDAAGVIDCGDGTWTESLRERYADRVLGLLERHIPNLTSATLDRTVLSPKDFVELNVNLEEGDPYSGALGPDQNLLWRPLRSRLGHETPVPGLFQIGASTHPGPGLSGASGAMVANRLITRDSRRRPWRRGPASVG